MSRTHLDPARPEQWLIPTAAEEAHMEVYLRRNPDATYEEMGREILWLRRGGRSSAPVAGSKPRGSLTR